METQPLYNPNDRLTGRDGGPYLDLEEARVAEERRARVENREPDFENLPATAGIPLVTAGQLLETRNTGGINSQDDPSLVNTASVEAVAKDKDLLLTQFSEREVLEDAKPEDEDDRPVITKDTSRQAGQPSKTNPVGLSEADRKAANVKAESDK